jgi:protein-tyrosine phosphatase
MIDDFIASKYGSKKGFVRYYYFNTLDFFFSSYKRFGVIPNQISRIVFVCKGNICRSPAAEAFFKKHSNLPCVSFGLDTTSGKTANEKVMEIAKEFDIDLVSHKTTSARDFTTCNGDLFVCMEPDNIQQLEFYFGEAVPTLLLGKCSKHQKVYIHDPFNANTDYTRACIAFINEAVSGLSNKLADACLDKNK